LNFDENLTGNSKFENAVSAFADTFAGIFSENTVLDGELVSA